MYKVRFSETALKQFQKLEEKDKERIIGIIERLSLNPFRNIKKLENSDFYRVRAGDFRIVYKILQSELIILVVKIGHRRTIYNNL